MLIDLVVVSAVVLFGAYLVLWLASPTLRTRIEAPKHVFLQQARSHDAVRSHATPDVQDGG